MTLFTENPTPIYWVLGALAVVSVFAFVATRRVLYLGVVGLFGLLAAGAWLVDYLVVTDRELVETKSHAFTQAAERGDAHRLGELMARDFTGTVTVGGSPVSAVPNRDTLLKLAGQYLQPNVPREIKLWVVEVTASPDGKLLTCHCEARVSGTFGSITIQIMLIRLEFTWAKDGDGQWRVQRIRVEEFQQQP